MLRRAISLEDFRQTAWDKFQLTLGNKGADDRPFTAADVFAMHFPENPFLLENVFRAGELVIIAGSRKTNKSFISLDILTALACGGSISDNIFAPKACRVVLIDAEFALPDIQSRLRRVIGLHGGPGAWMKAMDIVSLKHEDRKIDISLNEDQQWLEMKIGAAKIVVLDNFGKLIKHGAESCVKTWRAIAAWFERLQQKGITIILAHHENKTGEVRGTQKMEDDADLLISLKRPKEWTPADGNIVVVQFPASRHLHGDQVKPFTIEYADGKNGFKRDVRMMDGSQAPSREENAPAVSKDEVEKYQLSSLQIDMLEIARTKRTVKAIDVIDQNQLGRSATTVTNAFKDICTKGLLKAQGKGKGRRYIPLSE